MRSCATREWIDLLLWRAVAHSKRERKPECWSTENLNHFLSLFKRFHMNKKSSKKQGSCVTGEGLISASRAAREQERKSDDCCWSITRNSSPNITSFFGPSFPTSVMCGELILQLRGFMRPRERDWSPLATCRVQLRRRTVSDFCSMKTFFLS